MENLRSMGIFVVLVGSGLAALGGWLITDDAFVGGILAFMGIMTTGIGGNVYKMAKSKRPHIS